MLYNGTADTKLVLYWTKNMLLSNLPDNSVIVWDNASIHISKKIRNLLEEAGHNMIFLPPYSPDLNPIEHKWHELKSKLKSVYDHSLDFMHNLIAIINLMSSFSRD